MATEHLNGENQRPRSQDWCIWQKVPITVQCTTIQGIKCQTCIQPGSVVQISDWATKDETLNRWAGYNQIYIEIHKENPTRCNSISYSWIRASQYESVEITNKMQPCNRIYYSTVHWRLNMFRAAYRSSSGALNCICCLWFTYTCGDRRLIFPLSLDYGRSPHVYVNLRLQIQFRAPDDERYAARNTLSLQ